MVLTRFATLAVLTLAVASSGTAAENLKGKPDPSPLALWSAKGQTLIVRQHVPGLNAALLLTDQQVVDLHQAWRDTVDSPERQEKGKLLKLGPNTTEEQWKAFFREQEELHGKLQSRVAAILTPAQKELLTSIELLWTQANETVTTELAPEFARVKADANEAPRVEKLFKERLAMDLDRRLQERLSPEQRSAMEKAAAEEKAREAEAAAAPKK